MKNRALLALLLCLPGLLFHLAYFHRTAQATVSAVTNRLSYVGNGVTTVFAFPYYFQKNADLKVWLYTTVTGAQTLQTINTNYTVAGAGLASGGTVTMLVAPPTGKMLVVYDDPDQVQNLSMSDSGPFSAKQIELRLDKLTLLSQRLSNQVLRSIHLTEGDASGFDPTMPVTITPGAVFAADPTGKFLVMGAQQASAAQTAQLIGGGNADPLHFHASDRARANHTGTQLAATISDFSAATLAAATPAAIGAVPTTRTLTAGTGISGGGTLAADRTFSLADTVVTPAAYGSAILIPTFTVDQQGRLTAAATVAPAFTTTQLSASAGIVGTQLAAGANILGSQLSATAGIVGTQLAAGAAILGTQLSASANVLYSQLETRTLTAGTGLSGGGTLAADRTFSLANTAVTPAAYGAAGSVGTFTVDQQGRLTAAATVAISGLGDAALTNGANYVKRDGSVAMTGNHDHGGFQITNFLVENIAAGSIPAAISANRGRLLFDVTANEFVYSNGTAFIRASTNPTGANQIPIAQNSPTVNFVLTYNGSNSVWAAAGAGSTIAVQSGGSLVTGSPASTLNFNGGLQAGNVSGGTAAVSIATAGVTPLMHSLGAANQFEQTNAAGAAVNWVTMSGDVTLADGVATIAALAVTAAKIAAATITDAKMAALTLTAASMAATVTNRFLPSSQTAGTVVYSDGTQGQITGQGTAGQILQSAGSAAPSFTNERPGLRNLMINGGMEIDQRKEGGNYSTTAAYTLDRWLYTAGTSATCGVSRTAHAVGDISPDEPANYLSWYRSATGSTASTIEQRREDVRTAQNQTVTVSFYANASAGTPTINTTLTQNFGSGGSAAVNTAGSITTLSTSWTRYSYTVAIPSISGKTIGTSSYLSFVIGNSTANGAGYFTRISEVQVEIGSQPTVFEKRPRAVELALCQRYHVKSFIQGTAEVQNAGDTGSQGIMAGNGTSTGYAMCPILLPVTMRAAPTVTTYDPYGADAQLGNYVGATSAAGTVSAQIIGHQGFLIRNTGAISTANGNYVIHWSADAEL